MVRSSRMDSPPPSTTAPSIHWWHWIWPFSVKSRVAPQELPQTQLQGTQTSDLPPRPVPLRRPRNLRSMNKFPVDDDEVMIQEQSNNLTSFLSEIASEERSSRRSKDDSKSLVETTSPEVPLEVDLFHPATATSDPFYAPYGFIVMCCFQIVWGVLGIVQVLVFRYVKTLLSNSYILLDKNFSDHSPFYLMAAAVLSVIGGICGLVALAFDKIILLHLIPHFTWIILTMCLSSSITARGNVETPTISSYYRLFEAAALYQTDPSYLKEVWPGVSPDIWEEMQRTMKCCGVMNVTDWLNIPAPNIPGSCCLEDSSIICMNALTQWKNGKTSKNQFLGSVGEIKKYLHEESCIKMLTLERANHIRDWTTYPLIYLAFHLLIMLNLNYLTQLLIHEHQTWQGLTRLQLFKSQSSDILKSTLVVAFFRMIPFCCRDKKRNVQADLTIRKSTKVKMVTSETIDIQSLTAEDIALTGAFDKTRKDDVGVMRKASFSTGSILKGDGSGHSQEKNLKFIWKTLAYKTKGNSFKTLRKDSATKFRMEKDLEAVRSQANSDHSMSQAKSKKSTTTEWRWKRDSQ